MAHPGFVLEFNRPRSYRGRLIRFLIKRGFNVDEIGKTTFRITYSGARKFRQLRRALIAALDPRIGSLTLGSKKTAKFWRVNNRGNRPGLFVRV